MKNRREFFADDDDGDEVTYVDHKTESNSQVLLPSVDCKNGCDENKPVIDDHMSFLLNDSLRGRKWKPDYVSQFYCKRTTRVFLNFILGGQRSSSWR